MVKLERAKLRALSGALALSVASFAGLAFGEAATTLSPQAADTVANQALDQALAALEACPNTVIDLTEESTNTLGVLLFSPCHANERVVMDHAGIVVQSTVSAAGDLYVSLPVLDRQAPVSVTFEDGSMAEVALAAPNLVTPSVGSGSLNSIQDVSARW